MTMSAVVVLMLAGTGLSGCATTSTRASLEPKDPAAESSPEAKPPPIPERLANTSGLLFEVTPADAEVLIDGKKLGKVRDVQAGGGLLEMKPGIYQVSLKRQGFVTWRAEVTVADRPERIQVTLVEGR